MKKIVLAATLAAVTSMGTIASAGSLTEATIVEDTTATSSSSGEAQVLLLALMFALAVSD